MTDSLPMPLDVRLMNVTAALLATGLVLACVAAALWWVLRNPAFAIRQIVVTGDTAHHSAASLRATVGPPRLSGNFFTLDLSATQAAFQSVPWVRRAVVQREFPGRLNVTLQEHVAVAHWGDDDGHLINGFGEVFEATADEPGERELPVLRGPEGQSASVLAMHELLNPLLEPLDAHLAELTLQGRGNWRAELDSGAVIELGQGTPAELAARLRQFVGTVKEVAVRHQRPVAAVEAADLRHVGGYALRLRGVSTVRSDAQPAAPRR